MDDLTAFIQKAANVKLSVPADTMLNVRDQQLLESQPTEVQEAIYRLIVALII